METSPSICSQWTSIDFCAAFAILEGISWLVQPGKLKKFRQAKWQSIRHVFCVSDSQTVLKWLSGEYLVKTEATRSILEDIWWNQDVLKQNEMHITCQRVPGHTNIIGIIICIIIRRRDWWQWNLQKPNKDVLNIITQDFMHILCQIKLIFEEMYW